MSTYTIPELLKRWIRGEMTADQALGHVLQNLLRLSERLAEVEKRLGQLERSGGEPGA